MTQEELAVAGGKNLSAATIGLIERSGRETYRGLTLRALTLALGWSEDSIERIKRGENPLPVVYPPPQSARKDNDVTVAFDRGGQQQTITLHEEDFDADAWAVLQQIVRRRQRPSNTESEPEGP